MRFLLPIIVFAIVGTAKAEQNGTGLQISASVDIGGQVGLHPGSGATDRLDVREAEITLYAPADHLFDGSLSASAHSEGPIPQFELHEAYLGWTKLIPRSRFRVGQFFLGFGRLNQFHRHDWPFQTAPKVHREFFAPEGLLDSGFEYTFLVPTPFFLELTGGITNGYVYGHDHTAGAKPLVPTHYLRLVTYTGVMWNGGMQFGLNYLRRKGSEGTNRNIVGVDITGKWKEAGILQFLLQSEVWYREVTPKGGAAEKGLGFYVYPQYYIGENVFAGFRVDYFSNINLTDVTGATYKNFDLNFAPSINYKPSEFVTIRATYNHSFHYHATNYTGTERLFELQGIFILGAHPAHDF